MVLLYKYLMMMQKIKQRSRLKDTKKKIKITTLIVKKFNNQKYKNNKIKTLTNNSLQMMKKIKKIKSLKKIRNKKKNKIKF